MAGIKRSHTNRRMSQIVEHGDTVYLAGQVADDPVPDAGKQAKQILDKIDRHLEAAGSDKSKLLSAVVWLSDIRYYDAFNAVWDAWVPEGAAPARTCVETKLAGPQYWVEVTATAAK